MTRYAAYKDSGVEWIGEIPSEWEVLKIKHLATEPDTLFIDGDWIESDVIENEGIRYLTTGNIGAGVFKEQGNGFISAVTFHTLNCTKVYPNDLVISRLNEPVGRACLIPDTFSEYIVAVDNVILRPNKDCDKQFLAYFMNTSGYAHEALLTARGTTMSRISRTQLGNMGVVLPPLHTQQAIADYLDHKTCAIDTLIADKQKLIDLLKEKRQAIISEAVTKGLDKNAKMKDSGIEWIGEITEGWDRTKLKNLLSIPITDGPHETPEILDEGVPFISAEAVKGLKLDFNLKRGYISRSEHERFCQKCKPQVGDIFMIKSGATTGNVAMVATNEEFSIWSPLALIRSNAHIIDNQYLFYFLQSRVFRLQVELFWSYGTQQNIGMGVLGNLFVSYPNLLAQKDVVEYLDLKTSAIVSLIVDITTQIEKLKEYRQSIISEAVTGKVAV